MIKIHYSYYSMDFGRNKTPVEVIREYAFGGTFFRVIYSGINGKLYSNVGKAFENNF